MRAAFEKEQVLPDDVACRNPRVGIAELEVDELVQVAAIAVVMDARLGMRDRFFGRCDRLEWLVDDFDEIERRSRDLFAGGGNRRDRIADKPHLVDAQRVLVLGDGKNAERNRQIPSGEYGVDTLEARRSRGIDRADARVRLGAAQQLAVQHSRKREVIGESRRPRHLRDGVDFAQGLADDGMLDGWNVGRWFTFQPSNLPTFSGGHTTTLDWAPRLPPASVPPPAPPPRSEEHTSELQSRR